MAAVSRSRYLRTALIAGAFAASHVVSRADIMLSTVIVTADRIYDDYTVVITNIWDGDSWEIDFDIYFGEGPDNESGPVVLDPASVHFVGSLYSPADVEASSPAFVWESLPQRIGNVLGVTREYSQGYVYTMYIGGDGYYYYMAWDDQIGFHWKVEEADGSWTISPYGPPPVFAD